MFEILKSGGWLMIPILFSSVLALTICIERLWTLKPEKIAPPHLLAQVWTLLKNNQLDSQRIREIKQGSPLGRILASGLGNARHGRDIMKESIEETASHVVHDMERYLDILGTIAVISPLMGLLGTVIGMIKVFSEIMVQGTGNAGALAGGISQALITTAAGLCIAIPAVIMHRYFLRRVDTIVIDMEQETIKLVDALHGDRKVQVNVGNSK
ncbi:MAG: MotA/TolQ/ExbB proton channel family protein [Pseudomonadales bacterium]